MQQTGMQRRDLQRTGVFDGWRGIVLVAATYVYFLIFAQFGFLKRLADAGISGDNLKPVMGVMAAGGIFASLLVARVQSGSPPRRLALAFLGCAAAAACTLLRLNIAGAAAVALFIGVSLGALTVTLVAHLPRWIGTRHPLLYVGIGTGCGYFLCNFPPLFTACGRTIAMVAVGVCLGGAAASSGRTTATEHRTLVLAPHRTSPFLFVLLWFTALVWLDSAAFFIIQNSPALKSGTWEGAAHLWRTGTVHLLAALLSVWLLARRGVAVTLLVAFVCLGGACLLLLDPTTSAPAAILYPAGVSLYSVGLVAYPSLLLEGASDEQRSHRAGWIYAIAGWIGSAMGIGMAQHLHRIPFWFVGIAAAFFVLPLVWMYRRYSREVAAVAIVMGAAWGIEHLLARHGAQRPDALAAPLSAVERGRRVYISEGCINCHSQYVRPHSPDVERWGPAGNVEAIRREKPPLIGNRRQGPDLSNVGSRRSPLWLRIHLIDPRAVSYGSIMPSYDDLFSSRRGDDLVAYLESLKSPDSREHLASTAAAWHPSAASIADARRLHGARLYREYCATCHDANGDVRRRWGADFNVQPPDLKTEPLHHAPAGQTSADLRLYLARVAKFGISGTNMPGHEYLPDAQIVALANTVADMRRER